MNPWEWYKRGRERAIDALEAGEISYREYRQLQREALETFMLMVEVINKEGEDCDEDEPEICEVMRSLRVSDQ